MRRSNKRPERVVQWSKLILLGLLDVGEGLVEVMLATPYKGGATLLPKRTRGWYYTLGNLEQRGYVRRIAGVGRDGRYCLTQKGKRRVIKIQLRDHLSQRRTWDGKWRVLIFDVPERRRSARDFLRRELRLLGFKQLHRSVWVTPYDMPPAFRELLKESRLLSSTRFLIAETIDYDVDLRRWFDLPVGRHNISFKSSRS